MSEREILMRSYFDSFSITRTQQFLDEQTGQTRQTELLILDMIPCALSQNKKGGFSIENGAGRTSGGYLLFTMPEIDVQAGDLLMITTGMGISVSVRAGKPFHYLSHQEIPLLEEEQALKSTDAQQSCIKAVWRNLTKFRTYVIIKMKTKQEHCTSTALKVCYYVSRTATL